MIPLVQSRILPAGFHHGFTTRAGGVSAPPFDSLNLGVRWGDARENVVENRRRLREAAGGGAMCFATQVHGARVVRAGGPDDLAGIARQEADAVCADDPRVVVGIYVADCVPLVIADPRTGAFAAVHAGWRGTAAGVARAAVEALRDWYGSRPADLHVAMGPAIGPCCFEVGPEVVAAMEASVDNVRATGAIVDAEAGRPHVDLKRVNRLILERCGVAPDAIDALADCTCCDRERFYSYRRDHTQTGQLAGFITRADDIRAGR